MRGFDITASAASDVVGYRVSLFLTPVDPDAEPLTRDYTNAECAHPTDPTKRHFDLAGDPAFPNLDGTYNVEVRAIDDEGNTSPPLEGSLTLDFVAPDAPTNFVPF